MNNYNFWDKRAEQYNKLKWVNDQQYLQEIINFSDLDHLELVLDLGTGTGVVAKAISPFVNHVVGCDSSERMLQKGKFENTSVVKCDALNTIFKDNVFNAVVARMVFHHFTGNGEIFNLLKGFDECHRILKPGGRLIIAESIPPNEDPDVINFFANVRKFKEDRLTFTKTYLSKIMDHLKFQNVQTKTLIQDRAICSTKQWLRFSGLDIENQQKIWDMHMNASDKIKEAYEMEFTQDDIIVKNVNLLISGVKHYEL